MKSFPSNPLSFGLGPLPGTDFAAAADVVLSESATPHIPHLPDRGVGSDVIGRTAALLPIGVDVGPRGWRVTRRRQRAAKMARDQITRDLDMLEGAWSDSVGSDAVVKVQVAGPWTLAAELETTQGHRLITDAGANRDITDALAYAVEEYRGEVEKRLGVPTVLQLDEPSLPAIMAGRLKGTSDYEDIPAVHEEDVLERLSQFGPHLIHSPEPLFGATWFTLDTRKNLDKDALGEALSRGARIALPPMEPRDVFNLFDELQIDPAHTVVDTYAEPADTLLFTARNYRAAGQMLEALNPVK